MQDTVKPETMNIPTAFSVPQARTTTRKIGGTTFIVTSNFSSTGSGDVVSKIARLIRDEAEKSA